MKKKNIIGMIAIVVAFALNVLLNQNQHQHLSLM